MRKKLISLMLTGAFAVSALAGCGSSAGGSAENTKNDASKTTSENAAVSSENNTASTEGTTEIEFWYAGGKTAVQVVQSIIDKYNASQSAYHVSAVTQADYDETYQKLQAGIAGKAAPDVVLLDLIMPKMDGLGVLEKVKEEV